MMFVPEFSQLDWHWFGSVSFHYGDILGVLPGIALTARFAPLVAYRRRDALTLLFHGVPVGEPGE